jgi:hypothetical protein
MNYNYGITTTLSLNTWYHVALVHSSIANTASLYVNGVLFTSSAASGGNDGTSPLLIGSNNSGIQSAPYKTSPTANNPFMNVLMSDYSENPQKKEACDVSKGKTKKLVKKYFNNNLYRDVSDVYNKNASDRNYYTMPISTIPNDQESFAKYLYGQDKTCKEGAGEVCHKNIYRALQT